MLSWASGCYASLHWMQAKPSSADQGEDGIASNLWAHLPTATVEAAGEDAMFANTLTRFRALVRRDGSVIAAAVALLVFLAVLLDALSGDLFDLDKAAYRFFVLYLRRDWLTPIMQRLSDLASPVILAVLLLVVEAFAPGRRPGLCAGLNLVLTVVLNTVLKYVIQRPRPEGFRLVAEYGYSFPSGHSMVAMAFYGLLLWMVWHYERDRTVRNLCAAGFALVIPLVGISRIYLGVHYASDVIAGLCVSLLWLGVYTRIFVPLLLPETPPDDEL